MFCRNCGKDVVATAEYCPSCGAKPSSGKGFCGSCGAQVSAMAEICVKCGTRLNNPQYASAAVPAAVGGISPKSRLITLILLILVGQLGVHRFYVGKVGTGIVQLLLTIVGYATIVLVLGFIPLTAMWIWLVIDLIMLLVGKFKDSHGAAIENWQS
jgi:TM2 domain-containing membrane protein YozV